MEKVLCIGLGDAVVSEDAVMVHEFDAPVAPAAVIYAQVVLLEAALDARHCVLEAPLLILNMLALGKSSRVFSC